MDHARAEVARLVDDADIHGLIAVADLPITSIRTVLDEQSTSSGPVAVRIDTWNDVADRDLSASGRPSAHDWPWPRERSITMVGGAASALSAVLVLADPGAITIALLAAGLVVTAVAALRWWTTTRQAVARWAELVQRVPLVVIPLPALVSPTDSITRATAAYLRCRDAATQVAPPLSSTLHAIADRLASVVGAMVRLANVERERETFLRRLAAAGLEDPDSAARRPVPAVLADAAAHLDRHVESFERILQLDELGRDAHHSTHATIGSRIAALVRGIDTELAETGHALRAQIEARQELES
jgi:hypothetical protein